jgi:multidrug efflux pump subunit AcrB
MNLNPIVFALRHPFTVMVAIVALVLGSVLAVTRMRIDIFPEMNLPVIYVCQAYGGMDPAQMEGLITNYYEYHFLYINSIHHVESKNIQNMALMKLYFHPGTDMAQAFAETIGYVNRSRSFMPPGTVPPFVTRLDTGSAPVGYLVLSSPTHNIGVIQDLALFAVRPIFASIPGVSAPPPYGGNQRTIVAKLDPDRLRAYHASPQEVIAALSAGNLVSPSGNARIQDTMPIVPVNAMFKDPSEIGTIPIRPGENIYLRDLVVKDKGIEDSTDIPVGYALVNGRRSVYILVTKRADASTLSVVNAVKKNLPRMQAVLPPDVDLKFEFDQSPYVTGALWGLGEEGLLGAGLTGLMVLLFLRDWRSVLVVVLNIPFALLGSVVALALTGQTINLMTLGGLALAVGILVDEATVEVENIHTQFEHTPSIARAVRRGNAQTAVPRLLAMLCILAVFIPSFFMEGAAKGLFVPLSLAVGFAMICSYLLSSTFVPVLSVWLLRHSHPPGEPRPSGSGADNRSLTVAARMHASILRRLMRWRWPLAGAYLTLATLLIWLVGGRLGWEIFPTVDSGQFQLRLRAADGTRIETTEEITLEALALIQEEAGSDNVAISAGYVGLIPTPYTISAIHQWMRGPEEAFLRVVLRRGSGLKVSDFKERLRQKLPLRLGDWLRRKLLAQNMLSDKVDAQVRQLRLSFEPGDVINTVMSFGSPTPVEVAVSGRKMEDNRAYAAKIFEQLSRVPSLRDLQIAQSLDYPAVEVHVDRQRAGLSGVTAGDVSDALIAATYSSRWVWRNYWADPNTGIGYQVQVEVPPFQMDSASAIGMVPIKGKTDKQLLMRDVASIREGTMPGEYDRYNMRRVISMTANIEGEDLGRVAQRVQEAMEAAGAPPRGVEVDVRGQIEPFQEMFRSLALGLSLAVVVIFLMLTAYFQSLRLALAAVSAVPAVLAGVAVMLAATGTTLNIQSFMGAIMAIGVAVSNAILLVTFAEEHRRQGQPPREAALQGASSRLRPILMTSCAMLAGMAPMALALGEGGQQMAPLGRAVIGGLLASTLATLTLLPMLFAIIMAGPARSASLDPDDPASPHFAPEGSHESPI